MKINKTLISNLLREIVVVEQKPDNYDKPNRKTSDWWLGIYIDGDGMWDTTTLDREHAHVCRENLINAMTNYLADGLGIKESK